MCRRHVVISTFWRKHTKVPLAAAAIGPFMNKHLFTPGIRGFFSMRWDTSESAGGRHIFGWLRASKVRALWPKKRQLSIWSLSE